MARNTKKIMSVNALKAAARMADIDSLYRVIEQDPHVLKHIDAMPFVETPLHVVAASIDLPGYIQFATEIMTLKPSFASKLNPQGLTPIHVALQNGCNRMVLHLVDINKDLVRAKMRGGITPLHLASQSGNIELLTEFLKACPDSIEDVTVKGETALHLAAKYEKFDAFKLLVKSLKMKDLQLERTILNRKDEDGNTVLHIAALNNATEAIELLIEVTKFSTDFDAANLMGETALNLAGSAYIQRILVRARVTKIRKIGSILSTTVENRNAYLVVATLVATATYQAALSPPGGLHQTDNSTHLASNSSIAEGKSVMSNIDFSIYSTTNMCAFLASTFTIIGLLPKNVAWALLYISTSLLIISYFLSMRVISPNNFTTNVFVATFVFLLYIFSAVMLGKLTSIH